MTSTAPSARAATKGSPAGKGSSAKGASATKGKGSPAKGAPAGKGSPGKGQAPAKAGPATKGAPPAKGSLAPVSKPGAGSSAAPGPKSAFHVSDADFVAGAPHVNSLPAPALAELAFAGRSNVGKSSLLNAMMQRKGLARTSGTPGCTRQLNVFQVALADGLTVHFVDLPGYGYAKVSKSTKGEWGPMLEGYLLERPTLRAVCILVDVRRGVEEEDRQLLEFLAQPRHVNENKPIDRIVVVTKLDKLPLNKRKPTLLAIQKAAGVPVIGFSAETLDGREELWRRLRAAL